MLLKCIRPYDKCYIEAAFRPNGYPRNHPSGRYSDKWISVKKGTLVMYIKFDRTMGRRKNRHIILHEGKTMYITDRDAILFRHFKPVYRNKKK